jgi:hypothetical protein
MDYINNIENDFFNIYKYLKKYIIMLFYLQIGNDSNFM